MSSPKEWHLEEIKSLAKSTETIVMQDEFVVLVAHDYSAKRCWCFNKEILGYQEVDVKGMAKEIAKYLNKRMSLEKLLEDKILHEPVEGIIDLHKRVTNNGEVKQHKGCFYLTIKGKQGKPMELIL